MSGTSKKYLQEYLKFVCLFVFKSLEPKTGWEEVRRQMTLKRKDEGGSKTLRKPEQLATVTPVRRETTPRNGHLRIRETKHQPSPASASLKSSPHWNKRIVNIYIYTHTHTHTHIYSGSNKLRNAPASAAVATKAAHTQADTPTSAPQPQHLGYLFNT